MKKSVRPRKLVAPKANRQGFMAGVAALEWPPLGAQWDVHNSHLHHCASCLAGNRHFNANLQRPGAVAHLRLGSLMLPSPGNSPLKSKDCFRDLVR